MSVEVMAMVWKAKVSRPQKFVLLCLADFGNDEGDSIYPSVNYIAWKTGYSETQTRDVLQDLAAAGIITTSIQASQYGTNQYKINLDRLPMRPPYKAPKKGRPEKVGAKTGVINKVGAETEPILEKMGAETVKMGAVFEKVGAETEPDTLVNTSVKPSEELNTDFQKQKPDIVTGVITYAKKAIGRVDVGNYPEEVQATIERFCQLWQVLPPRGDAPGQVANWIEDTLYMQQAGGDLTIAALESLIERPYDWMLNVMISRPGTLIKAVRARAGELRREGQVEYTGGWTPEELAETREKIKQLRKARKNGGSLAATPA